MNTICKLTRHCTRHLVNFQRIGPCSHRHGCRYVSHSKKQPEDFIEWQENVRSQGRAAASQRGLDKFDDSAYNEKFKLTVQDEDQVNVKEKMVEGLLSAIELYKEREPLLKQDHPQFVQWCISRMWEFEITDRIEIYELLFECFPRHVYYAPGFVERLFPKAHPGLHTALDLINLAHKSGLRPSYTLYRNVHRSFGKLHLIVTTVRKWAWWHYVFEKANPYPLQDGSYDFTNLSVDHKEMSKYVAERTMDQKCYFEDIKNSVGEFVGTAIISETQKNLALLQTPNDNMRLSGPHSIWVGQVQRWYWVLRREERGDEFEGAPLCVVLSPFKEMSREAAQLFLEDYRTRHKGVAGSTVIFDVPDELLAINPEEHFKERVSLFSDGIEDVHVESSLLPKIFDQKKQQTVKKLSKVKENVKMRTDKDARDKDDEW